MTLVIVVARPRSRDEDAGKDHDKEDDKDAPNVAPVSQIPSLGRLVRLQVVK
jgi:hypothetical protein